MGHRSRRRPADGPATMTSNEWRPWKTSTQQLMCSGDTHLHAAYRVSSPTAVNIAKVIIDFMRRHKYLPTVMITDKSSVFVWNMIQGTAGVLGVKFYHTIDNQAQTLGVLEKCMSQKKHH